MINWNWTHLPDLLEIPGRLLILDVIVFSNRWNLQRTTFSFLTKDPPLLSKLESLPILAVLTWKLKVSSTSQESQPLLWPNTQEFYRTTTVCLHECAPCSHYWSSAKITITVDQRNRWAKTNYYWLRIQIRIPCSQETETKTDSCSSRCCDLSCPSGSGFPTDWALQSSHFWQVPTWIHLPH